MSAGFATYFILITLFCCLHVRKLFVIIINASGHKLQFSFFCAGAVGSGGVHQGRQGHCIAAVRGNDPDAYRGPPGCVPQTDEHGQAAHLRGNRQCPLRVPAAGEALHGAHHHQEQQHLGGLGDAQTVLPCGKETRNGPSVSVCIRYLVLLSVNRVDFTVRRVFAWILPWSVVVCSYCF